MTETPGPPDAEMGTAHQQKRGSSRRARTDY